MNKIFCAILRNKSYNDRIGEESGANENVFLGVGTQGKVGKLNDCSGGGGVPAVAETVS